MTTQRRRRFLPLLTAALTICGSLIIVNQTASASEHHPSFYYSGNYLRVSGQGIWQNRSLLDDLDERICDQAGNSTSYRAQFTYAIQDISTRDLIYLDAPEIMTVGPGAACKDYLNRFIAYRSAQYNLYAVNLKLGYGSFNKTSEAEEWPWRTGWRYNPYVVCTTCKDFQPLPEDGSPLPGPRVRSAGSSI
jgi:hypothetical protein